MFLKNYKIHDYVLLINFLYYCIYYVSTRVLLNTSININPYIIMLNKYINILNKYMLKIHKNQNSNELNEKVEVLVNHHTYI